MKPGRELDALVAEKVMGWADLSAWSSQGLQGRPPGWTKMSLVNVPNYSTDIAAAWQVVEKLDGQWTIDGQEHIGWQARFVEASMREDRWENPFIGTGASAPHAICLAALKAVSK